jgi:hypothetical protein
VNRFISVKLEDDGSGMAKPNISPPPRGDMGLYPVCIWYTTLLSEYQIQAHSGEQHILHCPAKRPGAQDAAPAHNCRLFSPNSRDRVPSADLYRI